MIMTTLQFLMLCQNTEQPEKPQERCCKSCCILCSDDDNADKHMNQGSSYYDDQDHRRIQRDPPKSDKAEKEGLERPEYDPNRGRPDETRR